MASMVFMWLCGARNVADSDWLCCSYTGAGLAYRASTSYGYLATQGYGGHIFPVVIGETGSQFIDSRDLAFFQDFSLYLRNLQYENDGRHAAIQDVFWW